MNDEGWDIMIAFVCIFIFVVLVIDCIFCILYEKLDRKRFAREQNAVISSVSSKEAVPAAERGQTKAKRIKTHLYQFLAHYGYGFMRLSILIVARIPSNRIRNVLYRFVFRAKITKKTVINGGVEIRSPWNLRADRCTIMNGCILDARHGIDIKEDVVFGTGVHIWTEEHDLNDPDFGITADHAKKVSIGERAWICSDSTILPGVTIAEGAVVAARACVVKDCDAYGVYGGVPAKRISTRNQNLRYTLSGKPHWHFY